MSEFGRGYAICLLMFTFHENRLTSYLESYAKLQKEEPSLFTEAHACQLWANGASDHLYGLVRPRKRIPRSQWRWARKIADRALDIGHGFRPGPKATEVECRLLLVEAKKLLEDASRIVGVPPVNNFQNAMLLDEALGLKPDRGTWGCEEPIPPRS